MAEDFGDRVVIVTGASAGIGRDIALAFGRDGAKVVVNGRDPGRTEAVAAEIRQAGGTALGVPADVTDKRQVAALVDRAVETFGGIDVLVNNAGGGFGARTVEALQEEDWDAVVTQNLKSVFLTSQAVLPVLKRRGGGRIVNISSQAGRAQSILAGPHYAAAKAGVIGLTRQVAKEAAPFGITVNAVAPGIILSGPSLEEVWQGHTPERRERILSDIPVGRLGQNGEVVAAVLFLASTGASYCVGATLDVNGGRWML